MDAATIRVFKSWRSPTARPWNNVYEAIGPNGFTGEQSPITAYDAIADAIVAAERGMHLNDVFFNRVVSSTWLPETGPYDPSRERARPLGLNGTFSAIGDAETVDLRNVLRLDRRALTGRAGRILLRGVLVESLIRARAGRVEWELGAPTASLITAFNAYKAALAPYVGAGTDPVRLGLIGGTLHKEVVGTTAGGLAHEVIKKTYIAPWHAREVFEMVMIGPTMLADDHAYFDKP